jgi:DNA-directed RNA polymerase specialized sigma24 family protein
MVNALNHENMMEVRLLKDDPNALIMKYQETIRIIVKKFITSGMFEPDELEETMQMVNVELIAKIKHIRNNYSGQALLKTYLSAIVRNICLKIHAKRNREPESRPLSEDLMAFDEKIADHLDIEQELKRLDRIVSYFGAKKGRLRFCLKLRFHLPLSRSDIAACFPRCSEDDAAAIMGFFPAFGHEKGILEVYRLITPFFNRYDVKDNTADAVRRWTEKQIVEIIGLLNSPPQRSNFNLESLQYLLEKYFSIPEA